MSEFLQVSATRFGIISVCFQMECLFLLERFGRLDKVLCFVSSQRSFRLNRVTYHGRLPLLLSRFSR